MAVLLELAKAQAVIAEVVESVAKSKPTIKNNSSSLSISAIEPKPYDFYADHNGGNDNE